jgi:hypothetical protein
MRGQNTTSSAYTGLITYAVAVVCDMCRRGASCANCIGACITSRRQTSYQLAARGPAQRPTRVYKPPLSSPAAPSPLNHIHHVRPQVRPPRVRRPRRVRRGEPARGALRPVRRRVQCRLLPELLLQRRWVLSISLAYAWSLTSVQACASPATEHRRMCHPPSGSESHTTAVGTRTVDVMSFALANVPQNVFAK